MTTSDYRTNSVCEKCESRSKSALKMLPFSTEIMCPECNRSDYRYWSIVCVGDHDLLLKKGVFGFGRQSFSCPLMGRKDVLKHFHYMCDYCSTSWMMLTASEVQNDA